MLNSFRKFRKASKGSASVEFALYLPVLLLLVIGVTEVSAAVMQSVILEKSMRSGVLYAARSSLPLSEEVKTQVANIVKKGNPEGTGSYLVDGWADEASTLNLSIGNYTLSSETSVLGSNQLQVVKMTVSVPYQPILGDVMSLLGIGKFTMALTQEQAHIGV
ncbi:TadE/TadG family type IV pilus assembly protein [Sneathiella chinensis]|uniref:TadE-like domain-containing protein n=1 Tax=Sneathiella chinensis TaxID=349750 RepID=A0ABQ5U5F2_9PROT|nr:TadE/TadG family type IV pilus assembly protein [Sneathiella chinensis]GLQ07382.1 hypothetical protein GCM10007924_26030 [Sneathiella chinensis]